MLPTAPSAPPPPLPPELGRTLDSWSTRIEPRLRPVLERHHDNLVALCRSLQQAGHAPEVVRSCLRDLLASYEVELVQSLSEEAAS